LEQKYDELLTADEVDRDSASSRILRITTKHDGFNDGQPDCFSHIEKLRTKGTNVLHSSIEDKPQSAINLVDEHISKLSRVYKIGNVLLIVIN
jgi:hypothetical protein